MPDLGCGIGPAVPNYPLCPADAPQGLVENEMTTTTMSVHGVVGVSVERDVEHADLGGWRALTLKVEVEGTAFGGFELTLFADDPAVLEPLAALAPSVKTTTDEVAP